MNNFGQLTLTSGSVGAQTFSANRKNIHFFDYQPDMAADSFIHLIADGEYNFSSSCRFLLESAPCYHFFYIYEGSMILDLSGKSISCEHGHVVFFYAENGFSCRLTAGKSRFYHASLTGAPLSKYAQLIPKNAVYPPYASGVSCLPECIQKLLSCENCSTESTALMLSKWCSDILCELALYTFNAMTVREQIPDYIRQMKHLFDTACGESYTLEILEKGFDKSRFRLCREFSHYYGSSPMQYLNCRRMEQAKNLLLTTSLPVHEIGSMVGIDNTNHFINLFKRETGATPLVFRQEAPAAISALHYPCTQDARSQ